MKALLRACLIALALLGTYGALTVSLTKTASAGIVVGPTKPTGCPTGSGGPGGLCQK
jgi:hypothetical protein